MRKDFNDLAVEMAEETQQINLAGFHYAAAGISNGRNANQLKQHGHDLAAKAKSKNADDLLDIIITQIPYEQYIAETVERLRDAQNMVDRALEIAARRFDQEAANLEELQAMAATLPDGTKVALDSQGNVRNLDGVLIDPELAAQVEFAPHNPSFEDIAAQQDRTNNAHNTLIQIRNDELQLGELSEELENSPSRRRADDINATIKDIHERTENLVNSDATADQRLNVSEVTTTNMIVPTFQS